MELKMEGKIEHSPSTARSHRITKYICPSLTEGAKFITLKIGSSDHDWPRLCTSRERGLGAMASSLFLLSIVSVSLFQSFHSRSEGLLIG